MIPYPLHQISQRARRLVEQVIRPAVFTERVPLDVSVHQCAEPIPYADAVAANYEPVELGFEWGPVWSTAWFRLKGTVPAEYDREFRLLFDTGTEACCWWQGVPYQGVELHRRDVQLPPTVRPGEALELCVEAACNHMSGVGQQFSDPPRMGDFAVRQRGRLTYAHLARHHPARSAARVDVSLLADVVDALPPNSPQQRRAGEALREVCVLLETHPLDEATGAVGEICRSVFAGGVGAAANEVYCTGNAHIDLAWLWPIRETKRKAARSFSTVLRNMERHEAYRFIQSQPQLYEWVRQDYPSLFEQIKTRVAEGQWEAAGGMWVEADCNIPSGESLVRQLLHGTRFFAEHFGTPQTFLWLPDVFGYSAALPQILRGCGMEAFITQKISWNQYNKFPHHSFRWTGIDGTTIPAHFLPADTYIAQNTPAEFALGDRQYAQGGVMPAWLQAYGWGDGGGGPTEASIARVDRLTACDGFPHARHASVGSFVERLVGASDRLPEWVGELYLELHRGTYTSQARLKRGNRRGETLLRQVELLHAITPAEPAARDDLDRHWKGLLLNQFHDIIPGSSIAWVNREAEALYDAIDDGCHTLIDAGSARWIHDGNMLVTLNARSHGSGGLVELPAGSDLPNLQQVVSLDGQAVALAHVAHRKGPGVHRHDGAVPHARATASDLTLENPHLRVTLDAMGRVVELVDKATGRDAVRRGEAANQLVLFSDRPAEWDAWDLEIYYRESGQPIETPASHRIIEAGPLRAAIEFERTLGASSRLVQRVCLDCDGRCVTFDTRVDWHEDRTLLRVHHPVDVHADAATFEIQYGHVRRPNHFNTSWDYARFESAAQRWIDLSEPGFGVALLNDCKYGHSAHGRTLGLSLLRSPREPDPTADRGTHRFRYALQTHGSFDAGDLTIAAEAFNIPLIGRVGDVDDRVPCWLDGPHARSTCIEAIKPAEEGEGMIVRLRETAGGRGQITLNTPDVQNVEEVDLLERPIQPSAATRTNVLAIDLTPFALRTFRLTPMRSG